MGGRVLDLCLAVMGACWLLTASLGCGQKRIATYPVLGVAKFDDGAPVSFGVVELRAEGSGRIARGKLDQFGNFELGTFSDGDGAVAGRHKAIVVQHMSPGTFAAPGTEVGQAHREHERVLVAPEFASYETSKLVAEVKPTSDNELTLVVRRFALRRGAR